MITLTESSANKLGKRATEFAEANAVLYDRNANALLPTEKASDAVSRTLTRVYGSPETIDRGEVAYWRIPRDECDEID